MKKKYSYMLLITLIFTLVFSSTAAAFQDISNRDESGKIIELKENKIINGKNESEFAPDVTITSAEAIQLLVRAFKLNLDHIQFIKAPKASDYFENIPDDAWYADAFIIAHHNGLEIPRDIQPGEPITKETYGHFLFQAMLTQ